MKRSASLPFFRAFTVVALSTLGLFAQALPGAAQTETPPQSLNASPALSDRIKECGDMEPKTYCTSLSRVMVSLSRPPESVKPKAKPGDFILRMTSRYGQSSCYKFSKIGYKVEYQDIYLNIGATVFKIDARDMPLHPEYECNMQTVYPSAEVPLNVDEMKKNGVEQIRFQDDGETDYYDVIYGDHYIEIKEQPPKVTTEPRYQPVYNFGNVKKPLRVWLYPAGTVILRASGVPHGIDIRGRLDALAGEKHLAPLENVIKGFTSPIDDTDSFYYVDTSKKRQLLKEDGIKDGIPFGVVTIPATVYGADGEESIERPIQVFAHTPGAYE